VLLLAACNPAPGAGSDAPSSVDGSAASQGEEPSATPYSPPDY
jgi:hypothetical protein